MPQSDININRSSAVPKDTAGRIVFIADAGEDFFFFIPHNNDKTVQRTLEGSMWFAKETADYGSAYRAYATLEALEWLRDTLGTLMLSKNVNAWLKAKTVIVPIAPIEGLPLFDYQREAIGFLWRKPRAMLSLSPGLGKTIVSLTAASLLPKLQRVLIICPASLLYMWQSEINKWKDGLPRNSVSYIWHGKPSKYPQIKKEDENTCIFVISNPETVSRNMDTFISERFQLMILDESIYYKNRKSLRTKAMNNLAKFVPMVWQLTGSPANRMLDDLWSQFHMLYPQGNKSYWRFAEEYCVVIPGSFAKTITANKRGAEQKIKHRFRDIYFSRSQEDVTDIPDWIMEEIDIPMTPYQQTAYEEIEKEFLTELYDENDNQTIISVNNHLSKVLRLIQLASNPMLLNGKNDSGKWNAFPELLKMYPPPFIIWTSFIHSAKGLCELAIKEGLVSQFMLGETMPSERQAIVDRFQKGRLDCIVLGQQVGSYGLTLTRARTAFYPERTYNGDYFQSLYRIRRIGTTISPNVVHMRSVFSDGSSTIDHLVHSLLDYRVEMIQQLTVGMLLNALHQYK